MEKIRRDRLSDDIIDWIPALRAFAWTLCRKQQEVDDLVQETLLKGIAAFHRYRPGTNLRAWLFTIMRNTFYSASVKTTRERPAAADCASTSVVVPATQEWSVRGGEVWAAVGRLPRHYREVIILIGMLGESYESVAAICGIPMGTVKSRLNRARAMLLAEMGETVPEPHAARKSVD
ncbi:sigma-70 family RNA polymerase sigma factor [Wenxinia marina]|uniref:RNA polymerase sigma factor n=1 Tax=Wenxinia marina DSM 24838 TaxID=1123501 RepID=A0A0D0Q6L4_9RHOB|nr:sigma-70 family RNA polymerase sigma factor [Wenxinia marina]KIQ68092.1 RNA polymerase sigma factor, sigma-70 family [Wenxinia marina DSM 24838]GGL78146.1 RNA polymerase sigma factor [Wenxinia marina]